MRSMYRLKAESDFRRVRSEGRSWSHPLFVLYANPNREKYFRAGYSISKRVGPAVVRNRLRRRLREILRLRLRDVWLSWDIVIVARQPAATAEFAHIVEAIDTILGRARLVSRAETTTGPIVDSSVHRMPPAEAMLQQPIDPPPRPSPSA